MTGGSRQLRIFRRAIRDGVAIEVAAEQAGMSMWEARAWVKDDAENPPPPEAYELLATREPEAAGCAVTNEGPEDMDNDDTPVIADMAADTLRGDVRDAMLSWFKATPKPWSQMGEQEQRNFAETTDRVARNLIKQACQIIAAAERPCIVAKLVEYKEKDGVEAKLKLASTGEVVASLHEACGKEVLIVTSGAEEFEGEEGPAEIDADQPDFPNLGSEYDEAA